MAERLALPTSDHGVAGSNPAGGEILPEPKRRFIAQSLSCSPFHRLEMTEILLKGRETLTHPSMYVVNIFKHLLLRNHKANQSQISYEASIGWGNENLFNWSRSSDQDGRHGHIW